MMDINDFKKASKMKGRIKREYNVNFIHDALENLAFEDMMSFIRKLNDKGLPKEEFAREVLEESKRINSNFDDIQSCIFMELDNILEERMYDDSEES